MLKVNNIEVIYNDIILVLRGVTISIEEGQIVSILGANGAGKTTTLRAISGLLHSEDGSVTRGNIELYGERIDRLPPDQIVHRGIVQVLEGRPLFRHLTVEENLLTGAITRSGSFTSGPIQDDLERVYHYFPRLKEFRKRTSGYLSGGEQQMVVIGRGLMAQPKLIMLDEPSLGLAPLLVGEIFDVIKKINKESGLPIILVEQNARIALEVADYAYVMENGRVVLDGTAKELRENEDIKEFYLGLTAVGERKSYRDVKHYRRRKRWLG